MEEGKVTIQPQKVEKVEEGKFVGVMITDLSSAFNMVPISILISKMQCFHVDGKPLSWMESFLSGRTQSTCIDGRISAGVPRVVSLANTVYSFHIRFSLSGPQPSLQKK